ncbi:MAG: hypothetical protein AABY22_20710, partial [Nanoarchaeota archaeon]
KTSLALRHNLNNFLLSMNKENLEKLSLEELIELCGDFFYQLQLSDTHPVKVWSGIHIDRGRDEYRWVNGATPKEAIINLYLKLNFSIE